MHRMRSVMVKIGLVLVLVIATGDWNPVRSDLIRRKSPRIYPDIAGDLVGSQTYTFDPTSKTGTFHVINAPQFIALGPKGQDVVNVTPDNDGTLSQTLRLQLDQHGRLVEDPENRFQLHGTVVIGDQVYRGLLLEGEPTAFGAQAQAGASLRRSDVYDLNVKITGGRLAGAFGKDAYFRIMPQSNSTFQGSFATSFSGDKPLTSLQSLQGRFAAPVPEPGPLTIFLTGGLGVALLRLCRNVMAGRCSRNVDSAKGADRPARSTAIRDKTWSERSQSKAPSISSRFADSGT
jgi:hypothetical protein